MATITVKQLRKSGACEDQVKRFRATFGPSVQVTVELCEQHAADFSFEWAAVNLLIDPALAQYERAHAAALAEYERVRSAAWAEYRRVCARTFGQLYIADNQE